MAFTLESEPSEARRPPDAPRQRHEELEQPALVVLLAPMEPRHLPEDVDTTKIDATLRDGLLTVHLPKDPAARKTAQKIAVKP